MYFYLNGTYAKGTEEEEEEEMFRGVRCICPMYSVIHKDGLNFVRLYFLNYTWYVNDLHFFKSPFICILGRLDHQYRHI